MVGSAPPGAAVRPTRTARALALSAVFLVVGAFLTACGERRLGWAVVLWAPQPGTGGSVLSISDESEIQDVYRYTEADTVHELDRWRVRLFTDQEQAAAFAAAFSGLANTFGYATRDGLPVRQAVDPGSPRLYRLREGEAVKIIAREDGPVTVGDYTNFWYQVLTHDGTEGFTFGEFLPLFDTDGDPQAEADRMVSEDSGLERITGVAWRPQYYADMLARRRIDLTLLDDAYGFTIVPAGDTLSSDGAAVPFVGADGAGGSAHIRLPELALAFAYERIDRIGEDVFVLQGSGVRIKAESDWSIAVSFQHERRLQTQRFVALDAKVDDLIAAERERRDRIYESLRESGAALQSSAYGELLLEPERRFRWSGFERLVPGVIPADAAGTGTITFRLHLARALRAEYSGALTMAFDRSGEAGLPASVDFVYARDDEGIRLVLAGEVDEEQLLVQGAAATPLVIYFRFAS
jgi:hypothetical protein